MPIFGISEVISKDSTQISLVLTKTTPVSDHTLLSETLGSATVADAFAELVDSIPAAD